MSHALDFTLGRAAIAYSAKNGVPWHGYGEHILPTDTSEEIAKKAGLDYTVKKAPAFYQIPNPNYQEGTDSPEMLTRSYENRAVLYRDDTGDALSVMSQSHYTPAQPIELLNGLMELTKDSGFEMDVCGALKDGRVVWGLAKRVDEVGEIMGDKILPYVLLLTSYDGTYARTGRMTSVRVVCQNTLSLSGMMDSATSAKQRNSAEFDLSRATMLFDDLGQFDANFAEYISTMTAMAKVKISDDKLKRFFAKVYAPKAFKDENDWLTSELDFDREGVTSNSKNNLSDLFRIFLDSPGSNLKSANGTLFGALNAVTYYQDHAARTKQDKRWESATIGNGNRTKDAALSLAMKLL